MQRLYRFIVDGYDREELRTLCFDLGVNYDALPDKGKDILYRTLLAPYLALFHKTNLDFLALGRTGNWYLLLAQNHPEGFD